MKPIQYTSLFLLAIVALTACSRKKDTFLNKKFHAVSTEYNTLFNGNNAFIQGKEAIAQTYRDDFYQILPVERIEVVDLDGFDTDSKDPNFNRAEEKAVKAIQKHSMYIGGKEYNPQIDEAYMLLGKARYYDNRFIPALDAFNFILNKSATSNNVNNAKIIPEITPTNKPNNIFIRKMMYMTAISFLLNVFLASHKFFTIKPIPE